jgi:serine/threonine protein kinase/Leucine-rich repeat (LRR) protein
MFACFTEAELRLYLEGTLAGPRCEGAEAHLRACRNCASLHDRLRAESPPGSPTVGQSEQSPHQEPTQVDWSSLGSAATGEGAHFSSMPDHHPASENSGEPSGGSSQASGLSVTEFIDSLSTSGLLPPSDVAQIRDRTAADTAGSSTIANLVDWLVAEQKLTRYQADLLVKGRLAGLVLGNYVILDKIGQGGMGTVFVARHKRMNRLVALKVLPTSLSGIAEAVTRFQREVEAAAKLHHQHIAAAYDADEASGVHFLVSEYVDGPNLAAYVRDKGPLPVAAAVRLAAQAARGLAAAHAQGIIHRDIKPSNLMVNRQGMLKILDLGLAQMRGGLAGPESASDMTQTGRTMGTVDYMAPEQARDAKGVDPRADIYSLGCTLYFLLAGYTPAPPGSAAEKLLWHQTQYAPPLIDVCPGATARLEMLVKRMMAKVVEVRPQSMNEVALELEACLAELPNSREELSLEGIEIRPNDASATIQATALGQGTIHDTPETLLTLNPAKRFGRQGTASMAQTRGQRAALAALGVGLLGVAVLALWPWLAPLWERPATVPTSQLIVTVDDGPADVYVNSQLRGIIDSAGGPLEIRLPPGPQRVEVKRSGYTTHEEEIETRLDRPVVVQARLQLTSPAPLPAPRPGIKPHAPYQELLTWVWSEGGSVGVKTQGNTPLTVKKLADLPSEAVFITGIDLSNSAVNDDSLKKLAAATDVNELSLANTRITDAGLAQLRKLDRLTRLDLSQTSVKGPGLDQLQGASELINLNLAGTPLTDQGIGRLLRFERLRNLNLSNTATTDVGLANLQDLKPLETLDLRGTGVSAETFENLRRAHRDARILWDGTDRERAVAQRLIEKGATLAVVDNQGKTLRNIRTSSGLPMGRFTVQQADLSTGNGYTADDLKQLVNLGGLESLSLVNFPLTPDDLVTVRSLRTLRQLELAAHRLDEEVLESLRRELLDCELVLREPIDAEAGLAVLELAGKVTILPENSTDPVEISDSADLPAGNYWLLAIDLSQASRIDEALLAKLHELAKLRSLSLADTPLTDELLPHLTGCPALAELDLAGTKVTPKGIASQLKRLKLTKLNLSRTGIGPEGASALKQFPAEHLRELALSEVGVTNECLPQLKRFTALATLDLSGAALDDSSINALAEFPALRTLDLRGTNLTDAGIEDLQRSPTLSVRHDPLDPQRLAARWFMDQQGTVTLDSGVLVGKGALPPDACRIVKLDLAELDRLIPDDILTHLAACTDLQSLDLSQTQLRDSDLAGLAKLPNLRTLRLRRVPITDRGLKELAPLTSLEVLDLANTNITGSGFAQLANATALRELWLTDTLLKQQHLPLLAPFEKLQVLVIGGNRHDIGDEGARQIAALASLQRLALRNAKITDASLADLANLANLEELDLTGTRVTDTGIAELEVMPSLRRLVLDGTSITDGAVASLTKIKSLRSLNLTGTRLSAGAFASLQTALGPSGQITPPSAANPNPPPGTIDPRGIPTVGTGLGGP